MNTSLSIKTPLFNHLKVEDFDQIYEPSEDSFLLIDAFERDFDALIRLKPSVCVEIGIGSGVVLSALGSALGEACKYVGTDLNPFACRKAIETGTLNGVKIETYCGDLHSAIPNHLKGSVDVLIFNPPYVVTESDEVALGSLELTWAGGKKGREVMDRLFPHLPSILSADGIFYLVLEKKNEPKEVVEIFRNLGFSHHCLIERKTSKETLCVMKFTKL